MSASTRSSSSEVSQRDRMSEPMRAREPDEVGTVDRNGVRVAYHVYGDGEPTVVLVPTWALVDSRTWKGQVGYLARHFRVVTFDPRGHGGSDRPREPSAYAESEYAADILAVMDAIEADRAVLVAFSTGVQRALMVAADHPARVAGVVAIGSMLPLSRSSAARMAVLRATFERPLPGYPVPEAKFNAHYWRHDFADWVETFMRTVYPEPHSSKLIEDGTRWALETDPETLIATFRGPKILTRAGARTLARRVQVPVLVLHGSDDAITPLADGRELARLTGGRLETVRGAGHALHARHPVTVNRAIRRFTDPSWHPDAVPTLTPGAGRRVLYLSSPIGLGHVRRDLAIAQELRRRLPHARIDWLAQDPVTRVLRDEGERIHPASSHLASEPAHLVKESGEHDLHVFEAARRMDEIMVNNFMVLHDIVHDEHYDLVVGDEAWEVDHHLHENPGEKRAAYAWLTDFVGYLPMPDGGPAEQNLAADYNAEMLEHVERHPGVRDRSLFVGDPEDIVPHRFGPDLPPIRDWVTEHFSFPGYITGFEPIPPADIAQLREELGYRPDQRVCVVTVGGSGVGGHLLRRAIAAYPIAKQLVPALRMIVVAGPRIDTAALPDYDGLEIRAYVPRLHRHLAVCDLAIVQGGLTTCMELTAANRPFLYVPLRRHFEQQIHVRHRLERYGAGRHVDYDDASPEFLADAIATEIGRPVRYRPVSGAGASRAARQLAELL